MFFGVFIKISAEQESGRNMSLHLIAKPASIGAGVSVCNWQSEDPPELSPGARRCTETCNEERTKLHK
jgi:hypothetical protein